MKAPTFLVVDLFCGAGGTTTGFAMAEDNGLGIAKVIACVNHDPGAIESHWLNHPEVNHYTEDIRTLDLTHLIQLVNYYRAIYPEAYLILWASLECTNFSKAKGGQDRDPDSRTLAHHLERYVTALNPDYVQIENVSEFKTWGPMRIKLKKEHSRVVKLPNGRKWTIHYSELATRKERETKETVYAMMPIKERKGEDFKAWCKEMCGLGYRDEWREMNSANYGAYTSRNRLFGCFAKGDLPIIWPETTHSKKPVKDKELWKAVKDVLDLEDEGTSLFERIKWIKNVKAAKKLLDKGKKCKAVHVFAKNRPSLIIPSRAKNFDQLISAYNPANESLQYFWYDDLCEKSLERIYAGLIKFVAGGDHAFVLKYNSYKDGKHYQTGIHEPAPTIPVQNRTGLCFITKYFSGRPEGKVIPVTGPAGAIRCNDGQAITNCEFIQQRNSGDPNHRIIDINGPSRSLTTTGGNQELVQPCFLTMNYSTGGMLNSIEGPAGTIPGADVYGKVQAIWLDKQYSGSDNHASIDGPAGSLMGNDKHNKVTTQFITRDFTASGWCQSIEVPAGALMPKPKINQATISFMLPGNYSNEARSVNEPGPTIMASRHHHYLLNPSYYGNAHSVEVPGPTIVARQDKAPLYVLRIEYADAVIPVYDTDSPIMVKVKEFMALYRIKDIKMRMLKVMELLKIQGFPSGYKLFGTQGDQKKFIGNSVEPHVVEHWSLAMHYRLQEYKQAA